MAIDLAKLVVSLEAQTAKYMQELDRANARADRFQQQINSKLGAIDGLFRKFGASIATYLTVSSFRNLIDSLDSLQESARAAGLGAQTFQAWALSAKQAGINSESFASGMARAAKVIGDAANGSREAADLFARLGVSIYDINGNVRSTESIVNDFADAIKKVDSPAKQAAASAQLFGRELGPKFVAVLEDGSQGLKQFAKDSALLIPQKTLDDANKFNDTLDTLAKATLVALAAATNGLIPKLTSIAEKFINAARAAAFYFNVLSQHDNSNQVPGAPDFLGRLFPSLREGGYENFGLIDRGTPPAAPEAPAAPPGLTSEQMDAQKKAEAHADKMFQLNNKATEHFLDNIAKEDAALEKQDQTQNRNTQHFYDNIEKESKALQKQDDDMKKHAQEQAEAFGDLFVQNLVEAADGGFKAVLASWARTLEQMALKAAAVQLWESLFPKGIENSGGGGGIWGTIVSGIGKVFGGGRAGGGPVMAGVSYWVGEEGPEIFTPIGAGNITPTKQLGGIAVNQTVNVGQGVNAGQVAIAMKIAKDQAIAEIRDQARRGR